MNYTKWKIQSLSMNPSFLVSLDLCSYTTKEVCIKNIGISEKHSRYTIQKFKQFHSISSLKGNILIHWFFFPFPLSCGSAFLHAMQTYITTIAFTLTLSDTLFQSAIFCLFLYLLIWWNLKKSTWETLRKLFVMGHCRRYCNEGTLDSITISAQFNHTPLTVDICMF